MHKVKIYCQWDLQVDFEYPKPIEIWVDSFPTANFHSDSIKILLLCEPDEISHLAEPTILNHQFFDYILTHDESILVSCPNARLFEFGTAWIGNYIFKEKEFGVSTVVGAKQMTQGHLLRHELWYNQDRIHIAKRFFISQHGGVENMDKNPILGDLKQPLYDTQFHIAVENVKKKYWFTEKLIDCFRTKTIPIYWGCPNIGDYFNTRGMFLADTTEEIVEICNRLTPQTYPQRFEAVEENFRRSEKFIDISLRLKNKLQELLALGEMSRGSGQRKS